MSVRRIARLARLSPSAVSLALNNSPRISEATRARVRALAERIGYRPRPGLGEVMARVRTGDGRQAGGCLAVVSLYDRATPWELSTHHARIYESMKRRAAALGYRLEPMWLRSPGMTLRRFRSILDARGIQGLLCFGSPRLDDVFPSELDHYAVVTVGMSIRTALHRVVSHSYRDMLTVLGRISAMGYRRPGLVIGREEDARTAHACSGAYLGWYERSGGPAAVPVLRIDAVEDRSLGAWAKAHRPDVLVFVDTSDRVAALASSLSRLGLRVPRDIGVAVVSHELAGGGFCGLQQNQELMGAWAIELLVARLLNGDLGIPAHPRIEMVESEWVEGTSLRPQPGAD